MSLPMTSREAVKILNLRRTLIACPSQWEGLAEKARPVYIRYRFGRLSVHIGPFGGDIWKAVKLDPEYVVDLGDPLEGWMPDEQMLINLREFYDLPALVDIPGRQSDEDLRKIRKRALQTAEALRMAPMAPGIDTQPVEIVDIVDTVVTDDKRVLWIRRQKGLPSLTLEEFLREGDLDGSSRS